MSTSATCVLNGCTSEQGMGTWVSVAGLDGPQPVCENHWKALREVLLSRRALP